VGAGIQIAPNGARVLAALGLWESVAAAGVRGAAVELIDGETGDGVARLPLPLPDHDGGVDFRLVHRADLIGTLREGALQAGVDLRLGQRVMAVEPSAAGPAIRLAGGEAPAADLVIGADGLHSEVRAAINGRVAPFFTHQVAWRATLPEAAEIPPVVRVFMGPGRHLVTYPLRGGRLRNIVAVEERRTWAEESWSLTDDPLALRIAFEGFVPEVRGWLDRIERPNLWGLFRHPVAERWHAPGLAILGDAAHPTLPFLAQGANMALEDAWVLAAALAGHDTAGAGLAAYQSARAGRVARTVAAAEANARNYHLSGAQRMVAHAGLRAISALAPGRLMGRFDWLYGFDATAGAG
jgi:salicylate hydroxylase